MNVPKIGNRLITDIYEQKQSLDWQRKGDSFALLQRTETLACLLSGTG